MRTPITKENMTKTLLTIQWNEPIEKAFEKMEGFRIRHLPVVDQDGFVIGILSDRDVNRAMNPQRPGFEESVVVGDFMSWPAITVDEKATIADVAEGMVDEKVSAFLVTKNGNEVVGIVTSEDLLGYLAKQLRKGAKKRPLLESLPYTPVAQEVLRELNAAGL